MDFNHAVKYYRYDAMRFDTGYIDEETFLDCCGAYEGEDDEGRSWRIEPRSGSWQVKEGDDWVVAVPPGLASSDAERYHSIDELKKLSPARWYAGFVVFVAIVILVQDPSVLTKQPLSFFGGLALIWVGCMAVYRSKTKGAWTGKVVELYDVVRPATDLNTSKRTTYAHVAIEGGKFTTVPAMAAWAVGDRIEKVEGSDMPIRRER